MISFDTDCFTKEFIKALEDHFMCSLEDLNEIQVLENFEFSGKVYKDETETYMLYAGEANNNKVPNLNLHADHSNQNIVKKLGVGFTSFNDTAECIWTEDCSIKHPRCKIFQGSRLRITYYVDQKFHLFANWAEKFEDDLDLNELCFVEINWEENKHSPENLKKFDFYDENIEKMKLFYVDYVIDQLKQNGYKTTALYDRGTYKIITDTTFVHITI